VLPWQILSKQNWFAGKLRFLQLAAVPVRACGIMQNASLSLPAAQAAVGGPERFLGREVRKHYAPR